MLINTKNSQQPQSPTYQEVITKNKELQKNVRTLNSRLKLMRETEQKNLLKAKTLERATVSLATFKSAQFHYHLQRNQVKEENQIEMQNRKQIITAQWQKRKESLEDRKVQFRLRQRRDENQTSNQKIRQYKQQLKSSLIQTQEQMLIENKQIYNSIREQEKLKEEYLQRLNQNKRLQAQLNYQQKIQKSIENSEKQKQQLIRLENEELELVERLKFTEQMANNSNAKFQDIKQKPFQEIFIAEHGKSS